MCGIVGALGLDGIAELNSVVSLMTSQLRHRGPDDYGVWLDPSIGLGLGHRRLAVLDLSLAGHQPMLSADERFVLSFNGEIYNHLDLRAELELTKRAPVWLGHSDTETLLAYISAYGISAALERSVGMFAISLWDRAKRQLTLARDRLGEKPLYYGWVRSAVGRIFAFGSELKALRAIPGFDNPIDRRALELYLQRGYVPAPYSIFEEIFKLAPGHIAVFEIPGTAVPSQPKIHPYWSLTDVARQGSQDPFRSESDAVLTLEAALREAIKLQAVADVPLGVFLSGGVDSSTIAALLQQQSTKPIQTYTVGFDEAKFNEAPFAREVAQFIGTEHNELRVTAQDAIELIPQLSCIYDEPFADSSQIPTYLICKAARKGVTVALSGEGGDEIFGGYNRHVWARRIWDSVSWLPMTARRRAAGVLSSIPFQYWDWYSYSIPRDVKITHIAAKIQKVARSLRTATDFDGFYNGLLTHWSSDGALASEIPRLPPSAGCDAALQAIDPERGMMLADSLAFLPNDLLVKTDRAAMAVGLETRLPFLDHRVTALTWRLPLNMKIRDSRGKWLLRQILCQYVPRELIDRPKAGFAIPLAEWLRGPLREWASELLDERRLANENFLNAPVIAQAWRQHLNGRDMSDGLWTVLMFQMWLQDTH